MNHLKSIGLSLSLALLLGSCGSSSGGCQGLISPPTHPILGTQAPNFVLPGLDGKAVDLATVVNQKPTLLVFWATWCPTCIEEIPVLNEFTNTYPGLQVLAVNVEEPRERVLAFSQKREIRYPIVLDEEGEVAQAYGLVGIPASLLLAKGGRVIYYGFTLPRNIEQLIKE